MTRRSSPLDGILDRYFEEFLGSHPQLATYAGLKEGEGRLGRGTPGFHQQWHKRRLNALRQLDQIPPRDLTSEQHLDRLAFRSQLLREVEDFESGKPERDPSALDEVLHILLYELQRPEASIRAATNLRSLLRRAPAFLEESLARLKNPDPVWRRILQQTASGAPALFKAVEAFLSENEPTAKDQTWIAGAKKACQGYADAALELPPAREGSFAVGEAVLARRVRDQLGLDYTLGEIESLAHSEIARLNDLLRKSCQRFGRGRSAEALIREARESWDPGADLVSVYDRETRRVAEAFKEANAMSFPPGETLEVRPVPEFMRHLFPTAAYSSPPPFAKRQRGIFWVNDLSTLRTTEAEKRLERQQHFGLTLTCAHEAYPGHHLQFATANRHARRWRRLFAHSIFYEGWTLWCEQMTVDLQVEKSPWLKIQQLHDALWRAHRILVDLRLQTRRYSYAQAVRHLQKNLGFTKARAEADVNWYTSSPTVPMSYWLGRLENERLREKLMTGRGWTLKQFNDWLLGFGTLPQAWIEKYGLI